MNSGRSRPSDKWGGGGGWGRSSRPPGMRGGRSQKKIFLAFRPLVWSKNKGPSTGSATDKSHLAGRFFDFFTVKKKVPPLEL